LRAGEKSCRDLQVTRWREHSEALSAAAAALACSFCLSCGAVAYGAVGHGVDISFSGKRLLNFPREAPAAANTTQAQGQRPKGPP